MKRLMLFLLMVIFFAASLFAASLMKEGKWEISMKMDLKGMPIAMPPISHTQCITKKDLEDNKKTLPSTGKDKDCALKEYRVTGRTVTWKTECKDGTVSTGKITYGTNSYSGNMKVETMDKMGGKSTIKYEIKGQRKGDC